MLAKLNGRSMRMEAMTSLVEVAPMVVEVVKNLVDITIATLMEMEVDLVIVTLTIAMLKLQVSWKFFFSVPKFKLNFLIVLQNDASRIKCWHCIGSECREDQNNYGSEITCPIGVTRCMVKGNRWSDKFHRSCEWEFKDPSMDQIGLDGYCAVTENAENMHICTCSTEKCNTGFHGPKCHIYKTSNCGSHGSIMGLDESAGPSVMPCLTGTKYCADITVGTYLNVFCKIDLNL